MAPYPLIMLYPHRSLSIFAIAWALIALELPACKGGHLNVNFTKLETNAIVDLSKEGAIDWIHWGLDSETSQNRKMGVGSEISDFSVVYATNGFAFAYRYADNLNGFSWSDGFPRRAATNTPTGIWVYGTPQMRSGFRFTASATTNEQS